jgi:serine/threonine protein kinase
VTGDPTDRGLRSPAGLRIGRYRVEAVIGTGGFATVYRAVDERLEDTVAVKVLAENHSLDPEMRRRFLTEGRVLRRIGSPHVIAVHDLGETDRQQPFLVLEYASRGTLADRARELRASGWQPGPADVRSVAEPLARALQAVHEAGVVHRDVNPGNVLLTTRGVTGRERPAAIVRPDERLVLADLGLCKDLALHSGHTSAGGTEGFRPPELRHGPAIIDPRADLWSLSALLVWLITGAPPDAAPVAPAIVDAGLPIGLALVLDRSLAEEPGARHPDALSWQSDVDGALPRPGPPPTDALPLPGPPPTDVLAADAAPAFALTSPVMPAGPPPITAAGPRPPRDWRWQLRQSAWVLSALPLGFTTWAGFLYIGLTAGRTRWMRVAAAYGAGAVLLLVLMVATPTDAAGDVDPGTWQESVGTAALIVLWFGGLAHALLANRHWLRWRAAAPA